MTGVLYTPDGAVIPPSDQVDLLQAVSPRLSLQYHVGLNAFVIALAWADDDPRRAMDREAVETGHAWSIEAVIPPTVPLDQMGSWALSRMERGGETAQRMVSDYHRRIEMANAARATEIGESVRNEVFETVNIEAPTIDVGRRRTKVPKAEAPV